MSAKVVVLDDGNINRTAGERLAAYRGQDITVVGRHPERLMSVLAELGITAQAVTHDVVTQQSFAEWPADIIVTGPPFDGAELGTRVQELVHAGEGRLIHVLSPHGSRPPRVVAATPAAVGWVHAVATTLRDTWNMPILADAGLVESWQSELSAAGGDLVLIVTHRRSWEGASSSAPPGTEVASVAASDIIHAALTDTELVVTNRTSHTIDVRVRLGTPDAASQSLASVELTLSSGEVRVLPEQALGMVGRLPGPTPVVRHWSHETETVYEGGLRRISGIDVRYRDPAGRTLAVVSHGSRPRVVVGITGSQIAHDLGMTQQSLSERWTGLARPRRSLEETLELLK